MKETYFKLFSWNILQQIFQNEDLFFLLDLEIFYKKENFQFTKTFIYKNSANWINDFSNKKPKKTLIFRILFWKICWRKSGEFFYLSKGSKTLNLASCQNQSFVKKFFSSQKT